MLLSQPFEHETILEAKISSSDISISGFLSLHPNIVLFVQKLRRVVFVFCQLNLRPWELLVLKWMWEHYSYSYLLMNLCHLHLSKECLFLLQHFFNIIYYSYFNHHVRRSTHKDNTNYFEENEKSVCGTMNAKMFLHFHSFFNSGISTSSFIASFQLRIAKIFPSPF